MDLSVHATFATSTYGNSTYDYSNTDGIILGPDDLANGVEFGIESASDYPDEKTKVVSLKEMQNLISKTANRITEQDRQIIFIRGNDSPEKGREIVEGKRGIIVDDNVEFRQSIAQLSEKRAYALLNTLHYKKEGDQLVFRPTDTPATKRKILVEALWTLRKGINENDIDYPLKNMVNYANVIDKRYPGNEDVNSQDRGVEKMLQKMYEDGLHEEINTLIDDANEAKEMRNKLLNINAQEAKSKTQEDIFTLLGAIWIVYEDYCNQLSFKGNTNNEPALKMLGEDLNIIGNNYDLEERILDIKTKKLHEILVKIAEKYIHQQKTSWIAELEQQLRTKRNIERNNAPQNPNEVIQYKADRRPLSGIDKKITAPIPALTKSILIAKTIKPEEDEKQIPRQEPMSPDAYIVPEINEDHTARTISTPKQQPTKTPPLEYRLRNNQGPLLKPGFGRTQRTAGSHKTTLLSGQHLESRDNDDDKPYTTSENVTNGIPMKKAIDTPSGSLRVALNEDQHSANE
ncbi:hypothetical protein KKD70_02685 [Patescibacteria group bacterium]|nr:hypothetical protein [Patescibacteria group bacterium]